MESFTSLLIICVPNRKPGKFDASILSPSRETYEPVLPATIQPTLPHHAHYKALDTALNRASQLLFENNSFYICVLLTTFYNKPVI